MEQRLSLIVTLILTFVFFESTVCQSTTSQIHTQNCSDITKVRPNYNCGRCRIIKIESFIQGTTEIKSHVNCMKCEPGYASSRYFESKAGDKDPDSFDFDKYCNTVPTSFWVWLVIISLVLITGLTLFLLRGKLPCFSQKRAGDRDSTLTSG